MQNAISSVGDPIIGPCVKHLMTVGHSFYTIILQYKTYPRNYAKQKNATQYNCTLNMINMTSSREYKVLQEISNDIGRGLGCTLTREC